MFIGVWILGALTAKSFPLPRLAAAALRVSYEERALRAHFGEAWRLHALERWRFVPFIL